MKRPISGSGGAVDPDIGDPSLGKTRARDQRISARQSKLSPARGLLIGIPLGLLVWLVLFLVL